MLKNDQNHFKTRFTIVKNGSKPRFGSLFCAAPLTISLLLYFMIFFSLFTVSGCFMVASSANTCANTSFAV